MLALEAQVFGGLQDEKVQFVHVRGKDIEGVGEFHTP